MAAVNTSPPVLTEQDIARFWKKVDKRPGQGPQGECWRFLQGRDDNYHNFTIRERSVLSHRLSFFLATGKWTTKFVCHRCDWRPCCNPSHLFEDTQAGNIADAMKKGRMAKGANNGAYTHPERRPTGDRNGSRLHPESLLRGKQHWRRVKPERAAIGTKHGMVKLSESDVLEIRRLHGQMYLRLIAERFDVSMSLVHAIIKRKIWKHI